MQNIDFRPLYFRVALIWAGTAALFVGLRLPYAILTLEGIATTMVMICVAFLVTLSTRKGYIEDVGARRVRNKQCHDCGYDCRGLERCPECGLKV